MSASASEGPDPGASREPLGARAKRFGKNLLLATACATLGAVAGAWTVLQPIPVLYRTDVVPADGECFAIRGRGVLLRAVLGRRPTRVLRYRWEFGDGCGPQEGVVTDPYAVWVRHGYDPNAPAIVNPRLTIKDVLSGTVETVQFTVRFVEPTLETKAAILREEGLWSLHATMARAEDPLQASVGCWDPQTHPVGTTAAAALAFELNGHDLPRARGPYRETVNRALQYLASRLVPARGGGISAAPTEPPVYATPLAVMALVASRDPDRVVTSGPEGVNRRTVRELVAGCLDYLARATCTSGNLKGGWRYDTAPGDADASATQWPVLAFLSAERVLGLEAPATVRTELARTFLKTTQGELGGFGYMEGAKPTVACTAAGLIALRFCGAGSDDPRHRRAVEYLGEHWKERAAPNDVYAEYAIMKAAEIADPPIAEFGGHDWRQESVERLFATQRHDGGWGHAPHLNPSLATAFAVLTLSKDVFAMPPPPPRVVWPWIVAGVDALLHVIEAWWRRRRRRAAVLAADPRAMRRRRAGWENE